jgi:hypothetical protein
MRIRALLLALAAVLVPALTQASMSTPGVPASLRQESVILRDGEPIGTSVTEFSHDGDRLTVRTHLQIAVTLLYVTVYRFDSMVEEQWLNGELVAMHTRTDDDGKRKSVDMQSADSGNPDLLNVTYNGTAKTVGAGIMPTSFWNPQSMQQSRFIDTLDGDTFDATVKSRKPDTVRIGEHDVQASRFEMSNDVDLWYTPDGHLLKIEFMVEEDGSVITVQRTSL